MDIMNADQFVKALECKYTSVGGYPTFFITADNGCVCHDCATEERTEIRKAIRTSDIHSGLCVTRQDVNWESLIYCDHCYEPIEAAYEIAE